MAEPIGLNKMRSDFIELVRLKKELGEWTDRDAQEHADFIQELVDQRAVKTLGISENWIKFQLEWCRRELPRKRERDAARAAEIAYRASPEFYRASLGKMADRLDREQAKREGKA